MTLLIRHTGCAPSHSLPWDILDSVTIRICIPGSQVAAGHSLFSALQTACTRIPDLDRSQHSQRALGRAHRLDNHGHAINASRLQNDSAPARKVAKGQRWRGRSEQALTDATAPRHSCYSSRWERSGKEGAAAQQIRASSILLRPLEICRPFTKDAHLQPDHNRRRGPSSTPDRASRAKAESRGRGSQSRPLRHGNHLTSCRRCDL